MLASSPAGEHQEYGARRQAKKAALDAGKILRNPKSTAKEREVAASDHSQTTTKPRN